jgi:peptidoglycan/LPS O-acetylase OafA/YrhL
MVGPGQGHIPELDGLRGIACLSIVIAHCIGNVLQPSAIVLWPEAIWLTLRHFLWGGVDLFFVLSGFLIGGILIDHRGARNFFAAFWTRRAGRILPVLLIVVGSYSLLLAVQPHINAPFLSSWLLAPPMYSPLWYLTFTQTIPMAMTGWGPGWLAVTWSLAVEEQFYLLFPFLVYMLPQRRLAVVMASLAILAPLCRGLVHHYVEGQAYYILLPCRMDGLSLGVLVAIAVRNPDLLARLRAYRRPLDVAMWFFAVLIVSNLFATWSVDIRPASPLAADMVFTLVYSALALFFALCILRIFLQPRGPYRRFLAWQPLTWFGLISYGLYMYHLPVSGLVHGLLFGQAPRVDSWREVVVALLVVAIATFLAALSYHFVETPIRRLAQRVTFKSPADQTTDPGSVLAPQTKVATRSPAAGL